MHFLKSYALFPVHKVHKKKSLCTKYRKKLIDKTLFNNYLETPCITEIKKVHKKNAETLINKGKVHNCAQKQQLVGGGWPEVN